MVLMSPNGRLFGMGVAGETGTEVDNADHGFSIRMQTFGLSVE
jgi:hypothetical protein